MHTQNISAAAAAATQTALMCLILGRLLYGVGLGASMLTGPKYIGETVPDTLRGSLLSMQEFAVVAGVCMRYVVVRGTIWHGRMIVRRQRMLANWCHS